MWVRQFSPSLFGPDQPLITHTRSVAVNPLLLAGKRNCIYGQLRTFNPGLSLSSRNRGRVWALATTGWPIYQRQPPEAASSLASCPQANRGAHLGLALRFGNYLGTVGPAFARGAFHRLHPLLKNACSRRSSEAADLLHCPAFVRRYLREIATEKDWFAFG